MESNRLNFAAPSLAHQPLMLAAIRESQTDLAQFLPWVASALSEEESVNSTQQAIENFNNFEGELRFSLFDKASGHFVGAIGLILRNKDIPYFEIGYWLKSSCVGMGYMTEAVKTLEDYAFNDLNAKRVEIKAAEGNLKSRAVAERCGYEFEGKHCNDRILPSGELSSTVVYAKTSGVSR
ncbi:GNAT family N-acetyltransferase [Celerinatantimonas yamalensis]|uniref:GNAT family N-acetyltransferase n=1 Tax=Celerinatantimonas yamalensis TaxID=559956 RepID=A0ABW9G8K1_9GAMM